MVSSQRTLSVPLTAGYAGFVPRSRGLLGHGFPIITHAALGEFTDEQRAFRARQREPATLRREPAPAASGAEAPPGGVGVLYPKCSGIVPHYTGHVPGEYEVSTRTLSV